MLNILSIAPYQFLPSHNGGHKGISIFYRFFSRHVHLTAISTANNDLSLADGYELLPVLPNGRYRYADVFLFFTIKKIIKQKAITHLLLEHPYFGWLGILLKLFCGVKLIVHSHNIESVRFKSLGKKWWRIMWWYEKLVSQHGNTCFFKTKEDMDYAVLNYKLKPENCAVLTYGIEIDSVPSAEELASSKAYLRNKYAVSNEETIVLFNGLLSYAPNLIALNVILNEINPLLLLHPEFKYKLIICGKGLPDEYNQLKAFSTKNIIYAGFVDDITLYYKGADFMINPVIEGGGIKTKLVESLAYDLQVISTFSGAFGVNPEICDGRLILIKNNDWESFATALISTQKKPANLHLFFNHFFWDNIAKNSVAMINRPNS